MSLNDDREYQLLAAQQEIFKTVNLILNCFNQKKTDFFFLIKIKRIQNICWQKCMSDGVDSYLSSKQEKCLENCADRFVDATIIATNRINQRLSGGSH